MAHFYGTLNGTRGEATRYGSRDAGMQTVCASWNGAVKCTAYVKDGVDCVTISFITWQGAGYKIIYDGPIDGSKYIGTI